MAELPHLVIFQAGNYAEAWHGLKAGAPETYREQHASVAYVESLTGRFRVTTLAMCPDPHDETLAPGLGAIGLTRPELTRARVRALMENLAPDLLIARAPHPRVLAEARRRRIRTLPCFADLFAGAGLARRLRNRYLRWLLSGPHTPCVANHSLNASRSAVNDLGLAPDRVVPWDWRPLPVTGRARAAAADPAAPRLFYAGALSAAKGVGDALAALAVLVRDGRDARLTLAGGGPVAEWQAEAARLGVAGQVEFPGRIPNAEVRARMAEADMVLVPSRHSYPEGMPNVIYEALAACTPLILSDHPAFLGRLAPGTDALMVPAGDPQALAGAVAQLLDRPALYAQLSAGAPEVLAGLSVGLEWEALVGLFLDDPEDTTGWVARNSLSALGY